MKVNRRNLSIILCIVMISVFSLTIAYAALNAVLTISGTAEVSASSWDIYLDNVNVTNGSVNSAVPTINSNTVYFSTTLNMPGDFYEFAVDVKNDGTIDAMIDGITKRPTLTETQAKYLKYEITYQNGDSINNKQLVQKKSFVRLKVRLEYRKDLTADDLPVSSDVLNLAFTVNYTQSDGSGSNVIGGGRVVYADDDINKIGTIVTIGTEQFYTIGIENNNVKLLSMLNITVDENPIQSLNAGLSQFSNDKQFGIHKNDYSGSLVQIHVNNYGTVIEKFGVNLVGARLITHAELTDSKTFACGEYDYCSETYPWIYSTTYWTGSSLNNNKLWYVDGDLNAPFHLGPESYNAYSVGVRPVIIISKDYFN